MESLPNSIKEKGTEVLLLVESRAGIPHRMLVGHWMPGGHCIEDHPPIDSGWYFFNGYMFDKASKPLMWTYLPTPPEQLKLSYDSNVYLERELGRIAEASNDSEVPSGGWLPTE